MRLGPTTRIVVLCTVALAVAAEAQDVRADARSPREALRSFLDSARAGRWDVAARALNGASDGPLQARRLKLVLDRHAWLDLSKVTDAVAGDEADDLAAGVDQIAVVPRIGGGSDPVRLARLADSTWRFSDDTVARIDGWYEELPQRWLLQRLPDALLRPGPLELLWWHWLALPILLGVSWFGGGALGRVLRAALRHLVARTEARWDDIAAERIRGPLRVASTIFIAAPLVIWLDLYGPAEQLAMRLLKTALFVCFFWATLRTIDVAASIVSTSTWSQANPSSRSLVPLASRVTKVAVVAIAIVSVLSAFGYPVTSLVAGLGIGGLAVALAAQKTFENLFGAFAVGVDQPFRQGDFVKIDDFVGTIEAVGLRSTRIRTLDRTVITLPNGQIAEKRVESFAERDRIRLYVEIGLVYDTTAEQLRAILDGLRETLRAHPQIWPDAVITRFAAFDASSLRIEVMAWFQTTDFDEFCALRSEVLLSFMEVVERAGSGFAFPTQTLHVARAPTVKDVRSHERMPMP